MTKSVSADDLPAMSDRMRVEGSAIFVTDTIGSANLERWVGGLRAASGQEVDWGWIGGRAVVYCIGDRAAVRAAIEASLPELEKLHRAACAILYRAFPDRAPAWRATWRWIEPDEA